MALLVGCVSLMEKRCSDPATEALFFLYFGSVSRIAAEAGDIGTGFDSGRTLLDAPLLVPIKNESYAEMGQLSLHKIGRTLKPSERRKSTLAGAKHDVAGFRKNVEDAPAGNQRQCSRRHVG